MATTAKLTFEDFLKLQDQADETTRYELDEGDVILTPSPTPRHNLISFRLRRALADFARQFSLGIVTGEVDFRLFSQHRAQTRRRFYCDHRRCRL